MQKSKYQNHDFTDEVPFLNEKKKTPSESVRRVISSFEAKTIANNTKKIAGFWKIQHLLKNSGIFSFGSLIFGEKMFTTLPEF